MRPRTQRDPQLDARILQLRADGGSLNKIAAATGAGKKYIHRLTKHLNVKVSSAHPTFDPATFVKLYNEGLNPFDSAKLVGSSVQTARRLLRQAGVKTEKSKPLIRTFEPWTLERKILLRDLRQQGLCWDEIAARLRLKYPSSAGNAYRTFFGRERCKSTDVS